MFRVCNIIVLAALVQLLFAADDDFHVVTTDLGAVRGNVHHTLLDHRKFYSFRGIPYAQPPVKELRFKPPKSPEPWKDVRDALAYGSVCSQVTLLKRGYVGKEDCLFINVFTPSTAPVEPLPVIFAIHGGAFSAGSGDWLGPELLLDRNVILVTFNYRLGPYGFLSLGTSKYPGNYGLKDQLLALQWVNRNIQHFGGDRSKITLYGHSAGAVSTHLHLLSPKSRDLFQRAIVSSGSALQSWAFNARGNNRDALQQFVLDHSGAIGPWTDEEFNTLLMNANEVLFTVDTAKPFYVSGNNTKAAFVEWAPVAEVPDAEEPFILETPEKLLTKLNSNVNTLFGYTNAEGLVVAAKEINRPELLESFNKDFIVQMPLRNVQWEYGSDKYQSFARSLRAFYFGDRNVTHSLPDYVQLLGDVMFSYGTHVAAREHSQLSNGHTYYYIFAVEKELNFFRRLANASTLGLHGAAHADEMPYLFKLNAPEFVPSNIYASLEPNSAEATLIRQFTQIFENFALHGNPTPAGSPFDWKPIQKEAINYVEFTNDGPVVAVGPNEKRFAFWDEFYIKSQKG